MYFKFKVILVLAAALILLWLFLRYQNNALQVSKYTINLPRAKKMRIVHLSDLHSKQFGKHNTVLFKRIEEQMPTLIVMTGDIIDASCKNYIDTLEFIKRLADNYPVYFVAGNHERRSGRLKEIINDVELAGASVLTNEIKSTFINGEKVNLLGTVTRQGTYKSYLETAKGKPTYADSTELLTKLENEEGINLVLCHFPENFALMEELSYKNYDFDIMFSGHAHGGQFILPIIGGVLAPGQGFNPQYYRGVYGSSQKLVVSRGLGNSSFPFRLFNRPEIVVVEINPKSI